MPYIYEVKIYKTDEKLEPNHEITTGIDFLVDNENTFNKIHEQLINVLKQQITDLEALYEIKEWNKPCQYE